MDVISILNTLGPVYHTYYGLKQHNKNNIKYKIYNDEESEPLTQEELEHINDPIPYNCVTILYEDEGEIWYRKPSGEWYNSPSTWFSDSDNALPYLNSKNYITVTDPYMSVTVKASEKGSSITIDDILFATRALASDDTRTYDEFKVIRTLNDHLILTVVMDNYST